MNNSEQKTDNIGRIRTLQASRFLFIFLIYLSHSVEPVAHSPFDFGGESGVAFFFALSGFVLSYGYGPRVSRGEFNARQFLWKHFWHLYPLHLLFFVLTLAMDYKLGHYYDWIQITTSLLLVQSWIPSNHTLFVANGVSWFLCDTLFCYWVFSPLYRLLMRASLRKLVSCFAIFALVYVAVAPCVPRDMVNCTLYSNPLLRCVDFGFGIMAYRCYKLGKSALSAKRTSVVNGGASFLLENSLFPLLDMALLVLVYVAYQYLSPGIRCAMLFWPIMPFVVLRLAWADAGNGWFARLLRSRQMMWLGGISFEIYISHLLVNRVVQHFVVLDGSEERAVFNLALGMVATILCAWIVQKAFVKPVYDVINRRLQR